jgi:hypothetical protein
LKKLKRDALVYWRWGPSSPVNQSIGRKLVNYKCELVEAEFWEI